MLRVVEYAEIWHMMSFENLIVALLLPSSSYLKVKERLATAKAEQTWRAPGTLLERRRRFAVE